MRNKGSMSMDDRWPVWKLSLMLYVFAVGAVAINLFMLGLLGQAVGLPALSPVTALMASVVLGIPAAWLSGQWARHLMDEGANP
ncbi:hypothetical protein GCM10017322_35160 [Paracoccus aerius]|nr:hypothetical protein GCM10017322_35160 [Paracoccus aerius]